MTELTKNDLLKIASHISYDWFNDGFCNFFDSKSYAEDLENLRDYARQCGIKKEVSFLKRIYKDATEKLEKAKYRYDDAEIYYIYNGSYIEDKFGKEELEQNLDSLLSKLGYVEPEDEVQKGAVINDQFREEMADAFWNGLINSKTVDL